MEKKLISYETLYVVSGNLSEEEVKAIVAKFSALVSDNGTLESVNEWGKRRLAYPINYIPEGYYVLVSYKSEPSFPREFERVLGITDGIIRSMTTKKIEGAPASAVPAPAIVAEEAVEAEVKAEEAPAKEEAPVVEEAPAKAEAPAAEEAPVAEEAPAKPKAPAKPRAAKPKAADAEDAPAKEKTPAKPKAPAKPRAAKPKAPAADDAAAETKSEE